MSTIWTKSYITIYTFRPSSHSALTSPHVNHSRFSPVSLKMRFCIVPSVVKDIIILIIITMRLSFVLFLASSGVGLASGQLLRSSFTPVGALNDESIIDVFPGLSVLGRRGLAPSYPDSTVGAVCPAGTTVATTPSFSDNFSDSSISSNWMVEGGSLSNSCSGQTNLKAVRFSGDNKRTITSVETGVALPNGGLLKFYLRYGNSSSGNCDPPESNESVVLLFQINNVWVESADFTTDGNDFSSFKEISVVIPTGATKFRLAQKSPFSSNGNDNWMVDDVSIFACDTVNSCVSGVETIFEDNFDAAGSNFDTNKWSVTTGGSRDTDCGGADGTTKAAHFEDIDGVSIVSLVSKTFAPNEIPSGAELAFFFRYGTGTSSSSTCKSFSFTGSDSGKQVKVEFFNGSTWGNGFSVPSAFKSSTFTEKTLTIPDGTTQFRFYQGNDEDDWAVDQVKITAPCTGTGGSCPAVDTESDCPTEAIVLDTTVDEEKNLVWVTSTVTGNICSWTTDIEGGGPLDGSCQGCNNCLGQAVAVPTEDYKVCVAVPACLGYDAPVCITIAALSAAPSSVPSSQPSAAPSSFPSSQPSSQPSFGVCKDDPAAACGFKFTNTLGGTVASKTSICVSHESADETHYHNKCVDNSAIGNLGPGDSYGKGYTIISCGCCNLEEPEDFPASQDFIKDGCPLASCFTGSYCNKSEKDKEVKVNFCVSSPSQDDPETKCESASKVWGEKYEVECGACAPF